MSRYELLHGDCLEKLKGLADNSVDAVVTDPPAGIAFMGRDWDKDKGGRREWIDWLASIMGECRRVLKPGGHAFVWALPRTSHWTATALEDAGFEIRECCVHIFGSGFPKSNNVSKAIDALKGAERPVVGPHPNPQSTRPKTSMGDGCQPSPMLTAPATPQAAQWEGFGTALKPASEHWWLCRKPLVGTVAENVLEWGTGALNVDGCRVGTNAGWPYPNGRDESGWYGLKSLEKNLTEPKEATAGRWPPNLLFSHLPECRQVGTKRVKGGAGTRCTNRDAEGKCLGHKNAGRSTSRETFHGPDTVSPDGLETVEAWDCADGCAVRELDKQSGILKSGGGVKANKGTVGLYGIASNVQTNFTPDSGGASRFFPVFRYQAKAPTRERWTYLTCDCKAGIIPAWVNEVRSQLGKMGVTSPPRATCAETTTGGSDFNTSSYGNVLTDPSLPDGKSTTETRTNSTIDWKTYSLSPQLNTSDFTEDVSCEAASGLSRAEFAVNANPLTQSASISQKRGGRCTGVAAPATFASLLKEKKCESCGSPITGRGHETVKPVDLMRWLVRLVTPPNGLVLDPFTGSGTTGVAALLEGFRFIGCEREDEYFAIATARLEHALKEQPAKKEKQATLFDLEAT